MYQVETRCFASQEHRLETKLSKVETRCFASLEHCLETKTETRGIASLHRTDAMLRVYKALRRNEFVETRCFASLGIASKPKPRREASRLYSEQTRCFQAKIFAYKNWGKKKSWGKGLPLQMMYFTQKKNAINQFIYINKYRNSLCSMFNCSVFNQVMSITY